MNTQGILRTFSYVTASMVLVVGLIILTGILLPPSVPSNFRITLGIMMTLWGVFRLAMTYHRQRKMTQQIDE